MEIPVEMVSAAFVAAGAAVSWTFAWITRRLNRLEKRSEECERDRVVLLKFAHHAVQTAPALAARLEEDLTQTQLIRLTKRHA